MKSLGHKPFVLFVHRAYWRSKVVYDRAYAVFSAEMLISWVVPFVSAYMVFFAAWGRMHGGGLGLLLDATRR